ncbi:MAG: CDP-alcohol phosphatidyltransferase family protein [Muribaculaceae bacterium]|nr:CDP-alcohol phosphatidyltransferase family protein [Muribaculaceae bacterium]
MANIITSCRVLCSILLLFFQMTSIPFYVLYLFCGLSDVLDGIIARKTHAVSVFGAKLDTFADFIFVAILLIKIWLEMDVPIWLWIWIVTIGGIKIVNVIGGFVLAKRFIVEHTILNKVTGVLLFLLPFTLVWVDLNYSAMVVCAVATISAIQDGYYITKGREII